MAASVLNEKAHSAGCLSTRDEWRPMLPIGVTQVSRLKMLIALTMKVG